MSYWRCYKKTVGRAITTEESERRQEKGKVESDIRTALTVWRGAHALKKSKWYT